LTQQAKSKKDFNILALYALGETVLTGKDQTGKILKTVQGLTVLKVTTDQGDLSWGY